MSKNKHDDEEVAVLTPEVTGLPMNIYIPRKGDTDSEEPVVLVEVKKKNRKHKRKK